MDLQFPHHESEIAQSTICNGSAPVKYWMHNNMITINGRKMGKSYNNVIKLTELFSGDHPLLSQAYHPMVVRFFILQSHYRSTLDFSNEALQASEKGLKRLWEAYENLKRLQDRSGELQETAADPELDERLRKLIAEFDEFMNDDFNTAKVLANMFELAPVINSFKDKTIPLTSISKTTFDLLQQQMHTYLETILGLTSVSAADNEKLKDVMQLLIEIRKEARSRKDFVTSDKIRNQLAAVGILLKDEKDGNISWSVE